MKPVIPYLFFNGNCQEAMNFYQQCFGGQLELKTYSEAPKNEAWANGPKDQIMHAALVNKDFSLMASDNPMSAPKIGDNIQLSIHCETKTDVQKLFELLSVNGQITMPLADTFWGSHFGMLIDKFGIYWILSCPLEK